MRLHDRKIKGEFWQDTELIKHLDAIGRMFFIGLSQLADDSGCVIHDSLFFKITFFPVDQEVSLERLEGYTDKLIELGKLIPYQAEGKSCLFIKNFHKHQTLKNCSPPSVPLPVWIEYHTYPTNPRQGRYELQEEKLYNYLNSFLHTSYTSLTNGLDFSSNLEPRTYNQEPIDTRLDKNLNIVTDHCETGRTTESLKAAEAASECQESDEENRSAENNTAFLGKEEAEELINPPENTQNPEKDSLILFPGFKTADLPNSEKNSKTPDAQYQTIFNHWNQQKVTVHKELSEVIVNAARKALRKYSLEQILSSISRYAQVYHDQSYYFKHKWSLVKFLTQGNCIPDFLDEGDKWINYQASLKTRASPVKARDQSMNIDRIVEEMINSG